MYDYREAVKADVVQYINDNIDISTTFDREELEQQLNDSLWTEDSVTGNASGSYTFNTYQAEENLAHNLDLLKEAVEEFGSDLGEILNKGAECADVTIRCYLLGWAISEALDELTAIPFC